MSDILIRGGGDLASGVALRLQRSGYRITIVELPQPLAVRRAVSFSEAIYAGSVSVEGVEAHRASNPSEALELAREGVIAVLVDPQATILNHVDFSAVVDARLLKKPEPVTLTPVPLRIGLGPGFTCGVNCHVVIETQRGHFLGHVHWSGSASDDTGLPEGDPRRVLRAPRRGELSAHAKIGDHLQAGQLIAEVGGQPVTAPLAGVLRGLVHPGISLPQGVKIGDIDPRDEPAYCFTVSDKALAVGGAALEALLARSILPHST